MREANFFGFFVGIESPDHDTLVHMSKKQNIKREISESVQKIYDQGMMVFPGFVVGFDTEKTRVADAIIQCIEESALPMAMVGLLYALPGTQLTRRLEKEGRLTQTIGIDHSRKEGDFGRTGLNFVTSRPRKEILQDYVDILGRLYEPNGYFSRVARMVLPMRRIGLPAWIVIRDYGREMRRFIKLMWEITLNRPDMRGHVWKLYLKCIKQNPAALRNLMLMVTFYLFQSRLSRIWIDEINKQIMEIDEEQVSASKRLKTERDMIQA